MRILDRYVLKSYLTTLGFAILAFLAVFIILDLFEKIDDFLDHDVSLLIIGKYYALRTPEIVLLLLPVGMLLACLFALGSHARNNEFVAIQSAGISVKRTLLPILAAALGVSLLAMATGETLGPFASEQVKMLENDTIKPGRGRVKNIRTNVSYLGENDWIYWIGRLDTQKETMRNVVVSRVSDFMLRERIDAKKATWKDGEWTFIDGYFRRFDESRLLEEIQFLERVMPDIVESPDDLAKRQKSSSQMSYRELSRFIRKADMSGGEVMKERVDLQMKLSFPFTSFVIVIFGSPLGALLRKSGNAVGIAVALLICFIFYITIRVGQALGYNEVLHPLAAAWLGNIIFLGIGLLLFRRLAR